MLMNVRCGKATHCSAEYQPIVKAASLTGWTQGSCNFELLKQLKNNLQANVLSCE